MRKFFVVLSLTGIFSIILILFWYQEWVYSLPTAVPSDYLPARAGKFIDLRDKLKTEKNKPVFLHFFNPDCPCSRFNVVHFLSLVKQYKSKIDFAVIVMTNDKSYTPAAIASRFNLGIPVIIDSSLAAACGVYSTPQAVLLDYNHRLYYRGNYNKSRYCTDKKSNYAQIAIDSLLATGSLPVLDKYASVAYGCSLPNCKK